MKALCLNLLLLVVVHSTVGSDYETTNFTVRAPDSRLAKQVGELAEKYRSELAVEWLGHELRPWTEKCPITVRLDVHAGGQTSFAFVRSRNGTMRPVDWQMEIFGRPERILDSVLPHEVTHTIFATHFGSPLPRWADEGACTTVEHVSERQKNHNLLINILKTGRGIPFNRMFAMKQYPHDIMPLYAQGYSLARYLIMQRGKQHFVKYVKYGIQHEVRGREPSSWDKTTRKFYGFKDLSELQLTWNKWVRSGSPKLDQGRNERTIPGRDRSNIAQVSDGNTMYTSIATSNDSSQKVNSTRTAGDANSDALMSANSFGKGWYFQQMQRRDSHQFANEVQPGDSSCSAPGNSGDSADCNEYRPGSIRKSKALDKIQRTQGVSEVETSVYKNVKSIKRSPVQPTNQPRSNDRTIWR